VAQLPGFLTPGAVSQMTAEADRLAGRAWASDQSHTVYFEPPDDPRAPTTRARCCSTRPRRPSPTT
jgi:hypothetical protein